MTANTASLVEMESINPLIDSDSDTYRVGSALAFMTQFFDNEEGVTLDGAQSYGVSIIMATCAAALRHMQAARE